MNSVCLDTAVDAIGMSSVEDSSLCPTLDSEKVVDGISGCILHASPSCRFYIHSFFDSMLSLLPGFLYFHCIFHNHHEIHDND